MIHEESTVLSLCVSFLPFDTSSNTIPLQIDTGTCIDFSIAHIHSQTNTDTFQNWRASRQHYHNQETERKEPRVAITKYARLANGQK